MVLQMMATRARRNGMGTTLYSSRSSNDNTKPHHMTSPWQDSWMRRILVLAHSAKNRVALMQGRGSTRTTTLVGIQASQDCFRLTPELLQAAIKGEGAEQRTPWPGRGLVTGLWYSSVCSSTLVIQEDVSRFKEGQLHRSRHGAKSTCVPCCV